MRLPAVVLTVVLAGCGATPPPAPSTTPPPTTVLPVPSPVPLTFPLRVEGNQFIDAAGVAQPRHGASTCCGDKQRWGWPFASAEFLNLLEQHFYTFVHGRLGPHKKGGPDDDVHPFWLSSPLSELGSYVRASGWTAEPYTTEYERRLIQLAEGTALRRIALEVDAIDCWGLKTDNNYYGWTREIVRHPPTPQQKDWIRYNARLLKRFNHVVWQTCNEGFAIGSAAAWELGVKATIEEVIPDAIVSTNSHNPEIERRMDYVNRHQKDGAVPSPLFNKPTGVNESGPVQTPEQYEARVHAARAALTFYDLWPGDMSEAQLFDALARGKRIRMEDAR